MGSEGSNAGWLLPFMNASCSEISLVGEVAQSLGLSETGKGPGEQTESIEGSRAPVHVSRRASKMAKP